MTTDPQDVETPPAPMTLGQKFAARLGFTVKPKADSEPDEDEVTYPPPRRQVRAAKRARKTEYRKRYRAQERASYAERTKAWNDPDRRSAFEQAALIRYRELVAAGATPKHAVRQVKREGAR